MELFQTIFAKVACLICVSIGVYVCWSKFNGFLLRQEAKKIKEMEFGAIEKLNDQYRNACKNYAYAGGKTFNLAGRAPLDLNLLFKYSIVAKPFLGAQERSTLNALKSTHKIFVEKNTALEAALRANNNDQKLPWLYLQLLDSSMAIWYQLSRVVGDEFVNTPSSAFKSAEDYQIALRRYFHVNADFLSNIDD